MANFQFVAAKAYGDLTIMLSSLRRLSEEALPSIEILAGLHLRPMFEALGLPIAVRWIEHSGPDMPALFDVKRRGIFKAAESALDLHSSIARAARPGARLVFDAVRVRERFIALGLERIALPKRDNIYLGYEAFLEGLGFQLSPAVSQARSPGTLRIFPGSRVPAKNLPVGLVDQITESVRQAGIPVELLLLEGERPDLMDGSRPFVLVPRSFDGMVEAVRGAGLVISADSMPAHVAEFVGRPVFVFSPVPNAFWLPLSAFVAKRTALFAEGVESRAFEAFLHLRPAETIGSDDRPEVAAAAARGGRP